MERFIAERFRSFGCGLALDTGAISKYTDLIDLSIGDTDIVTDEKIISAAFRDAKAGHTHYGDPHGDPELIDAVCRAWSEDFRQSIEPERVLVTASSCLGMSLVMLGILDPGDEVLVFSPYFPMYREQIELAGGVCVEVPTYASEGFAIKKERLDAAITTRTKAMVFNNPTNPTAMAYGADTMRLLAETAKEHDLLIVADEIYTSYMFSEPFTPMRTLPGMAERTVTLNSFSKNYLMTGWHDHSGACTYKNHAEDKRRAYLHSSVGLAARGDTGAARPRGYPRTLYKRIPRAGVLRRREDKEHSVF